MASVLQESLQFVVFCSLSLVVWTTAGGGGSNSGVLVLYSMRKASLASVYDGVGGVKLDSRKKIQTLNLRLLKCFTVGFRKVIPG
jgi:hypothetical protein